VIVTKRQGGWFALPKGGEAMSGFEIIMIVFGAVTITLALIKIMINLADKFSHKGK